MDTVEVTIPVEARAAAALADAGTREMVGCLVSRVLERCRRETARLFDVMDRFATEAREAGLTDGIVAQESAAHNAERRG